MHSDAVDKSGSPRKRILSRAMSEEESLRNLIQEAEETPKRLTRRDSRYGSLRRGSTKGSQSEEEPVENTAMMELEEDYKACLEEMRSVERHQDVLLFQLDCLHDALEGAEEALAEAQRENYQMNMELEREREQRRRLEVTVASLMEEMERLKEEKNSVPPESTTHNKTEKFTEVDGNSSEEAVIESVDTVLPCTSPAVSSTEPPGGSDARSAGIIPHGLATASSALAFLSMFYRNRRSEATPLSTNSISDGTSVDQEAKDQIDHSGQSVTEGGIARVREDNDESSGYEDAPSDFSPGSSTPEGSSDLPEDEERELKPGKEYNPENCVMS